SATITDLHTLMAHEPKILQACTSLIQLGLGHLTLGHPLSELSGGEAQRVKLIPFLSKVGEKPSLLIFDEPTTGLHLYDVRNIISLFRTLTERGHTVLCIEHNQELILSSDWLIDLGPEGGENGGELSRCGTPQSFLDSTPHATDHTARFLQKYYQDSKQKSLKKLRTVNRQTPHSSSSSSLKSPIGAQELHVCGANEHNLKNLTLSLPHDHVIAITGVSGSGKSTLAKDIIYAEGQRRYLDCLSPYARQFIHELSKPDVREIRNIRPTICVYQHTFKPGQRSTLGTMSEVYNYLRLLFSKAGIQYCPDHPTIAVETLSAQQIADRILQKHGHTLRLLAPIVKGRKGNHKQVFARALRSEILEVRVDGIFQRTASLLDGLERNKQHDIEFVWATVVPERIPPELLINAIEEVFALSGGTVIVSDDGVDEIFSRERACPVCRRGFFRPDPEDLSFHSLRGRCTSCDGTGITRNAVCKDCHGSRLKPTGRNVRIEGKSIADACILSAPELKSFLLELEWDERLLDLTGALLEELVSRLDVLTRIGLDYLPLARGCEALSSGELQRLRLSAALGTPLSGSMYIFDEPSAGLHPDDNHLILNEFQDLKYRSNTILLIEHDEETILSADHVIEIGPGGGSDGGNITYNGPTAAFPGVKSDAPKLSAVENLPSGTLRVEVSKINNIDHVFTTLPLHRLIAVTGVSGAGKSSFLSRALLPALMDACEQGSLEFATSHAKIGLSEELERVLVIDQTPIGRNSRSTPASYLKVWDEIRNLFAATVEARTRGWSASFFSYNSGDGRCSECKGLGKIQLEMSFLSEAFVTCDRCKGKRYGDEALSIRYGGYNIADVLGM
ncbi:MAG: hypothetical protein KDD60_07555, partial [Bdellovibrionales bacterium]|nr:hypothetical protein [Bdellovibrionales bacterium]